MKVNTPYDAPVLPSNRASSASVRAAVQQESAVAAKAALTPQSASVAVTVSPLAQALQAGAAPQLASVDTAKVKSVKAAIADGSYVVNPEAIADKLLANAADMLTRSR